jgi:hypothetical protein
LLEALLCTSLDEMTAQAAELETSSAPDEALVTWLRDAVAFTQTFQGITALLTAALDDPKSALHASCVTVRAAGARLLSRAQAEGKARSDIDGTELFALIAALAWLGDQPSLGQHAEHLFEIIASAILTIPASDGGRARRRPRTRG